MDSREEYDDGFSIRRASSGERVEICAEGENTFLFVLQGKVRTVNPDGQKVILSAGHMYNMSTELTFRTGYALEDSTFICLKSDELIAFSDWNALQQVIKSDIKPVEFHELRLNAMIIQFLNNIILLKEENITSRAIYDLKKRELLFIMRYSYSTEDLTMFALASISAKSPFKLLVYSKYTNSISVQQLAGECFMTPKTFTKHFKEEFKATPYKWMLQKRIKNLKNDIYYKSYPIHSLLKEYGFSSEVELKKFCKRHGLEDLVKILR